MSTLSREQVQENIKEILFNVQKACEKSNQNFEDIKIMAVTKTVPPQVINYAIESGIHLLGENRVQEFLNKKDEYKLGPENVHFIGHLQTNKVRQIVPFVDCIQTIDSIKLAKEVDKRCGGINKKINILVQVNISKENTKSGVMEEQLYDFLCEVACLENLKVQGLMTIPAFDVTELENRRTLERMRQLFVDMKGKNVDNINMRILSMGMSSDYIDAIECGSNLVRIGSSLFGYRK